MFPHLMQEELSTVDAAFYRERFLSYHQNILQWIVSVSIHLAMTASHLLLLPFNLLGSKADLLTFADVYELIAILALLHPAICK